MVLSLSVFQNRPERGGVKYVKKNEQKRSKNVFNYYYQDYANSLTNTTDLEFRSFLTKFWCGHFVVSNHFLIYYNNRCGKPTLYSCLENCFKRVHFIKVFAPAWTRRRDYTPRLAWKVTPPSANECLVQFHKWNSRRRGSSPAWIWFSRQQECFTLPFLIILVFS